MKIIHNIFDSNLKIKVDLFIESFQIEESFIFKTSGTTSHPKDIIITKNQLLLSAQNTIDFLSIKNTHTLLLCLDLAFIASKMQIIRAIKANATLILAQPQIENIINITHKIDFASYVPLQLKKIIESNNGYDFLNNHKAILIGGAHVDEELYKNIQNIKIPVYQTFGMTETASHFAFRLLNTNQKTDYYQILPNVIIETDENNCLRIKSNITNYEWIQTSDIVEIIDNQSFKWIARNDFVINSGGIKINPETLELKIDTVLNSKNLYFPFVITSIKDVLLGEALALVIEGENNLKLEAEILNLLKTELEKYHCPKKIFFITKIPHNINGKVLRNQLKAMIL